jgi:hypothetical protein
MSALRYGLYMTTGRDEKGRFIAIVTDGTPQLGHQDVTVLTLEVVEDEADAARWFDRMKQERPWEVRH